MNRTARRLVAVACTGVLLLALAACGDDAKKPEAPTLTSAAFRSQANALCKTAYRDVTAIQNNSDVSTTDGAKVAVTTFADRIDKLVADLRTLNPPTDLKVDVTVMLDTVTSLVATARQQGPTFLQATTNPFADANKQAVALGLPECAGGPAVVPVRSVTPLSPAEFRLEARAICKSANAEMNALTPGSSATTQELDAAYHSLAALLFGEVEDLKVLNPPTEIATRFAAFLDAMYLAADTVNNSGAGTASLEADPFLDPNAKAKDLGLTVCARG